MLGSRAWHVELISCRWADCVDEMIVFTARYHCNPCAHLLTVSLSLTSRSQSTAIPIMEGWQLDFVERRVERQSMEMRMCWRLNKAFPLLTYLSSCLYRFSNPVALMVILRTVGFDIWFRWYQLTSWSRLRSSKIRASICQGHVYPTHLMT